MQRIEELAALSEYPTGLTRRFSTTEHRRANQLVAEWMQQLAPLTIVRDANAPARAAYESDLVLLRPDQFVAWVCSVETLSDGGDAVGGANGVLERATGRGCSSTN